MINKVIFTKQGIKLEVWDSDTREYTFISSEDFSAYKLLRESVEIENGVTLHDIFSIMEQNPKLKEFISEYACCPWMDEFHLEAKQIPELTVDEDPLAEIKISKYLDLSDIPSEVRIDIHGVGSVQKDSEELVTNYSISMSPMHDICNLPIKLDKLHIFKDNVKDTEIECSYSVLEVLYVIYWEISFHGGPGDRKIFRDEIIQRRDDFESGKIEGIPWEDVKDLL